MLSGHIASSNCFIDSLPRYWCVDQCKRMAQLLERDGIAALSSYVIVFASFTAMACANAGDDSASGCTARELYGASSEETYLRLLPVEKNAVVWLKLRVETGALTAPCSGVLVRGDVVLTAAHCAGDTRRVAGGSVRVGGDFSHPVVEAPVEAWQLASDTDLLALRLSRPIPSEVARPLPIWRGTPETLIGSRAVLAGYGLTESDTANARLFATEPIVGFMSEYLFVDGAGESGACLGDSGGPLVIWSEMGPSVAGILEGGDASCSGSDRYTVASFMADAVDTLSLQAPSTSDRPCGALTSEGRCYGSDSARLLARCESGITRTEPCMADEVCGFTTSEDGYRCLSSAEVSCDVRTR